jgi:hypothetical protein
MEFLTAALEPSLFYCTDIVQNVGSALNGFKQKLRRAD